MRELLWYNGSPVCGLSAWWLCGVANGDLLPEDLGHTCCLQVCWNQSPSLRGSHGWPVPMQETLTHSKAGLAQSLVGSLGPSAHKVLFEPSKHLWWVWSLILNMILPFLLSCWGFSFAVGCEVSFSGGIQHSPVDGCSAASCNLEFLQERMSAHPSTPSSSLVAGKDLRQKEKWAAEDKMFRWHHRLNGLNLSKLKEIVEDRGFWHDPIHGVAKSQTQFSNRKTLRCL